MKSGIPRPFLGLVHKALEMKKEKKCENYSGANSIEGKELSIGRALRPIH